MDSLFGTEEGCKGVDAPDYKEKIIPGSGIILRACRIENRFRIEIEGAPPNENHKYFVVYIPQQNLKYYAPDSIEKEKLDNRPAAFRITGAGEDDVLDKSEGRYNVEPDDPTAYLSYIDLTVGLTNDALVRAPVNLLPEFQKKLSVAMDKAVDPEEPPSSPLLPGEPVTSPAQLPFVAWSLKQHYKDVINWHTYQSSEYQRFQSIMMNGGDEKGLFLVPHQLYFIELIIKKNRSIKAMGLDVRLDYLRTNALSASPEQFISVVDLLVKCKLLPAVNCRDLISKPKYIDLWLEPVETESSLEPGTPSKLAPAMDPEEFVRLHNTYRRENVLEEAWNQFERRFQIIKYDGDYDVFVDKELEIYHKTITIQDTTAYPGKYPAGVAAAVREVQASPPEIVTVRVKYVDMNSSDAWRRADDMYILVRRHDAPRGWKILAVTYLEPSFEILWSDP